MEKKKLGILGGMGSEATVLFYKKIIDNTSVNNDREHLDILIYNHASIPDRTECILCGKQDYLWDIIAKDIRGMEQLGCEYFAIPCNTCHYFADRLQELTNGKFINMIEETARYASVLWRQMERSRAVCTKKHWKNMALKWYIRQKNVRKMLCL